MRNRRLLYGFSICCILISMVLVGLTSSAPAYNLWLDVNDDGVVDISDITAVIAGFGSSGEAVTKASLESDSGWINITDKCGEPFYIIHNLNSTDIIVDIQGKTAVDEGIHQRSLGETGLTPGWTQTYGGTDTEYAYSVIQTVDGGYAMVGYTGYFGAGGYDFWLVKTDAYGNHLWNQTYGGTDMEDARSVVQTVDGGYVIAGQTYSFGIGNGDLWLVRVNMDSGLAWTDSTLDSITLYRGATDSYWNYVRVRIWKIRDP